MAVVATVQVNEDAILKRFVEKLAEYWDGRTIPVTYKDNAPNPEWSDGDENGNRVPGTWDAITSIVGTINATASGTDLKIDIVYEVTIENKG